MKTKIIIINLIAALLISSCANLPLPNVPVETDEAMVKAIHTLAAQTVIASMPTQTLTPRPTFTDFPTGTPFATQTAESLITMVPTALRTSTLSPAQYCENIQFWRHILVDPGEVIAYDTKFTKTWAFKNIGTCEIGPGYVLTYYGGDDFGEHKGKLKTVTRPGEIGQVSIAMTAPQKPGTYSANYMFVNPNGFFFGPTFQVRIVVPKPTTTPTPVTPDPDNPDDDPTETATVSPTPE